MKQQDEEVMKIMCSRYNRKKGCYPKGCGQVGKEGPQEPKEIEQGLKRTAY